jgi:L-ascorbate metabolism protein UlaG (beta-lactamase superfamily)
MELNCKRRPTPSKPGGITFPHLIESLPEEINLDIQWLGHSCFRIRTKDASIIVDPFGKELGYSIGRPTANILLITHDHTNHNQRSVVSGDTCCIDGPGEYEVAGVFITGVQTFHDGEEGKRRGTNNAYIIEADDLVLCHLGDLGHVPTPAQVEEMNIVDILFVPVGGHTTIGASQAAETVRLLEPKLVVPMHYWTEAAPFDLDKVDRFLRELGSKPGLPQPKLSVNRSTLPSETEVILLEYKAK